MGIIKKQEKKHKKEIHGLDPGISRRPRKRIESSSTATEKSVREAFSGAARFCAVLLLGTLIFQPIDSVFASEAVEEASAPVTEAITVETTEIVLDDRAEEVRDENVTENNDVTTESTSEDSGDADGAPHEETSVGTSTKETNEETASSTEKIENDTDFTSEGDISDEKHLEDNASTTEAQASSTDLVTVVQPEVSVGGNDENRFQFGVSDCVAVEDGFFYCTKNKPLEMGAEDRFYAAQDADGDFEIFISKGGVDTQITHNLYDDNAPFYDGESETLVWHALIDDRYQIIKYDLKDNKLTQLTTGPENSMEPVVSGSRIVWQSWVLNNWEIILDDAGVRTQLTQNESYDIDPHVRGDLISWQTREGDTWHVEVYDILTKKVEVMEAGEGASVENPRFVLMYDSKKENGDVETVGYDLKNKKIIPLGAFPASVPKDIPEPEHSKETRAIVQSAPNLKEETVADEVGATTTPAMDPPEPIASSTTATSTDFVIPDLDMSVGEDASTPSPLVSEEYTLDLRTPPDPLISLIPDLIIAPTSPSQDVASSTVE